MDVKRKEMVEWITTEHPYYEKSSDWFWIVGIVGATATLLLIVFNNLLFGIIIAIATIVVVTHGGRMPGLIVIRLNHDGIQIGEKIYEYKEFASFSVDNKFHVPILTLLPRGFALARQKYVIEDVDEDTVRDYLLGHLDETYHEHTLLETAVHYLGF